MNRSQTLQDLILGAHTLTRTVATEMHSETPVAQWRVLALLREHGPLRVGELATLSRTTQPGVTRLVGAMSGAGLIVREADADDSRAVRVAITDHGRDAYDLWCAQLVDAMLPRFAGLGDEEWRALRTTADLVARRIGGAASSTEDQDPADRASIENKENSSR